MRTRFAATIVAAGLIALVTAACGTPAPPTTLPWTHAVGLRLGVQGWWNTATLSDPGLSRALGAALAGMRGGTCGVRAPEGGYTVTLLRGGGGQTPALVWQGARLWWRGCAYVLPDTARWVLGGAVAAARRAWSGQLLTWDEVSPTFPVKSQATVIDWATGRSLQVVRWGGVHHADVEPLTAADASALKAIYAGTWSWARRPVLVLLPDGTLVAASINGMPHGGGSVGSNAFSGHFCVHFLGSEVHQSDRIDERHLMAILTAAGAFGDGPQAAAAALTQEAAAPADGAAACD